MVWHLDADTPLYSQIISNIEVAIASGFYKPGSQIPPVRTLAMEALEQKKLLFSQRTKGRFVTSDTEVIETMKKNMAKEKIENFISEMTKLGFTQKEIIEQIELNMARTEAEKDEPV